VANRLFPIKDPEEGAVLLTVRELSDPDTVQTINRELELNTAYMVSASCHQCKGTQIPLLEFTASVLMTDGCGGAPQMLGFSKFFGVYI